MSVLETGPSIVLYHLLPSILAALVYFLLAKLFIFLFRVKKPSVKYIIYFLALYKSLLLLFAGARYSYTQVPKKPFGFGFVLYDPMDLLPFGTLEPVADFKKTFHALQSPFLVNVISIILIIIVVLLVLRWIATAWFLKKVVQDGKKPGGEIKTIVADFSSKLKIKRPDLVLSPLNIGPLVIGVIRPKIILPANLANKLNTEELQIIIGHELAHIKRRDNLWQWLALFIKDLLFFNPFALTTYRYLQLNKEIATDNLFLKILPDKVHLLKKTLQKVVSIQSEPKRKDLFLAKANFLNLDLAKNRLETISAIDPKINKATILTTISTVSCLILFFWFKIWIAIKLGKKALLLLS